MVAWLFLLQSDLNRRINHGPGSSYRSELNGISSAITARCGVEDLGVRVGLTLFGVTLEVESLRFEFGLTRGSAERSLTPKILYSTLRPVGMRVQVPNAYTGADGLCGDNIRLLGHMASPARQGQR